MRRAFYLLAPGSWRDYPNLVHAPYTAWHLSYVAIGAAMVPHRDYVLLGWTLLAFFLALGIGAHALDELRGRPLGTRIPAKVLWAIGLASVTAAAAIGGTIGVGETPLILPFIATGIFLVLSYNLEWGPFHHDLVFAFAWGAFPLLTSYFVQSGGLTVSCVIVATTAAAISLVQRTLSARVRYLRRKVVDAHGYLVETDGTEIAFALDWLVRDYERVLKLLSVTMPAIAIGLLLS